MSWQPYWGFEDDILELGIRFRTASDEASALEHRFARANGVKYGCPPLHWQWEQERALRRHRRYMRLQKGGSK